MCGWVAALGVLLALILAPMTAQAQAPRLIEVYCALADNVHQGIVPVPASLGNGQRAASNLYWGALYGLKSYFKRSKEWRLISCVRPVKGPMLELCLFKHRRHQAYLLARAYDGRYIKQAIYDFLAVAAGGAAKAPSGGWGIKAPASVSFVRPDLVAYVGHNGLMEYPLPDLPKRKPMSPAPPPRQAIILACAAKPLFGPWLKAVGADPLIWTTGLMAPEAYTLHDALGAWLANAPRARIRTAAAAAYHRYQRCGLKAAKRLLVTGY